MDEQTIDPAGRPRVLRTVRSVVGIGLIGCGGFVAFEILDVIRRVVFENVPFGLIQPFIDVPPAGRTFLVPDGRIEISDFAVRAVGYLLLASFLITAAGLATTLIRGGIHLLDRD